MVGCACLTVRRMPWILLPHIEQFYLSECECIAYLFCSSARVFHLERFLRPSIQLGAHTFGLWTSRAIEVDGIQANVKRVPSAWTRGPVFVSIQPQKRKLRVTG